MANHFTTAAPRTAAEDREAYPRLTPMMEFEKDLPLGSSSFVALRDSHQIYVDKTDFIYTLACQRGKIFLSRPRRFGKSLLVSTFETLFRDGLTHFDGLKIADRWKDRQYHVLTLDFSEAKDFDSIDEFCRKWRGMLKKHLHRGGFSFQINDNEDPDLAFGRFLAEQDVNSLVLLIDEYDAPLNAHIHQSELFEQTRKMLSQFYSQIKSSDEVFRFIFMTGITKFNKSSIFSAFNNLTDISLSPRYGTLLGYTKEEIMHSFKDHVEHAARLNKISVSRLMDAMRDQYDGFCFDENASSRVYAPWSVLSFLNEPEQGLQNFWYGSAGKASMVINYLKDHDAFNAERYDTPRYVKIDDLRQSSDLQTLSDDVLMFQAGYLTIKEVDNTEAILGYPNKEVASAIARLAIDTALRRKKLLQIGAGHLRERLSANDPEDIVDLFNAVFLNIDYQNNPIKNESACRAIIQVLLLGAGLSPIVERHNALGRSDLELSIDDIHWVFEFKFLPKGKSDKEANVLLGKAIRQMQDKQYGEVPDEQRTFIRMAMVFSEEQRQIAFWNVLEH